MDEGEQVELQEWSGELARLDALNGAGLLAACLLFEGGKQAGCLG